MQSLERNNNLIITILLRPAQCGGVVVNFILEEARRYMDNSNETIIRYVVFIIHKHVPLFIIKILVCWYSTQKMHIRWGNIVTSSFLVSNGIKQGGIL